ncbi:MAG: AGE family epimerase/isomerase [Hyphomicrobiaceae bacterium]
MLACEIDAWIKTAGHLWFEAGWDQVNGGFFEHLNSDGTPVFGEDRRVRVQFRQIFSMSFCHHHGYVDFVDQRIDEATHFVWDRLWGAGGKAGFPHVVTPTAGVSDARRDTYDHAFAMLAFGWAHHVTGARHIADKLSQIISFTENNLLHDQSGFKEALGVSEPRRQNPHMHCFEAYLALFETTKNSIFLDRIEALLALFKNKFWDSEQHLLREYFSDDWSRHPSDELWNTIEPGHMAEWVWLLRRYQVLTGGDVDALCKQVFARTTELGLDNASKCLWDGVAPDASVTKATRRLWPQTEFLKSTIAEYNSGNSHALRSSENSLRVLHAEYLNGKVDGGWHDQFDSKGRSLKNFMPASSHYHLVLALHEARKSERLMQCMEPCHSSVC